MCSLSLFFCFVYFSSSLLFFVVVAFFFFFGGVGLGGDCDGNGDMFVCRCGCYCRFKLIVVVLFYWHLRFCGYGGRSSYIYPVIFKRVVSGVLAILYRW